MRLAPIYVDPEAFCQLTCQVNVLNHRFPPYEYAMDHCVYPKRICHRLIALDNALQHVNAELISREVAPEKIQKQINRIELDLCRVEAEIGVLTSPEDCAKNPRVMASSLNRELRRVIAQNPAPKKLLERVHEKKIRKPGSQEQN